MNTCALIGRLTRDPETRYTQGADGKMVANYTIAVDRGGRKDGEQNADFIRIVAFDKAAEFASKYFRKGLRVGVVGRIQTRSYKDKGDRTVNVTEIIADRQYFADGYQEQSPAAVPARQQSQEDFSEYNDLGDDMPF